MSKYWPDPEHFQKAMEQAASSSVEIVKVEELPVREPPPTAIAPKPGPGGNSTKVGRPRRDDPWDRQPNEPPDRWEAFSLFLELPKGQRKATVVADHLEKPRSSIQAWATKWRWVERADAYDKNIDMLMQDRLRGRFIKLAEKRVEAAEQIITRCLTDLQRIDRVLTPFEIARLTEVATKLGEPVVGPEQTRDTGIKLENVLIAVAHQRDDPRMVTD